MEDFKEYVFSFYGYHPDGLYLQELFLDRKDINKYCDIYVQTHPLLYPREDLAFDSVDRERVRDIILNHHEVSNAQSTRP